MISTDCLIGEMSRPAVAATEADIITVEFAQLMDDRDLTDMIEQAG